MNTTVEAVQETVQETVELNDVLEELTTLEGIYKLNTSDVIEANIPENIKKNWQDKFELYKELGGDMKNVDTMKKEEVLRRIPMAESDNKEFYRVEFKNMPLSIYQLNSMMKNGKLSFDFPIQRASDAWTVKGKSLLIYSIASGNPIPPIFFIQKKEEVEGKVVPVRRILDGMQRLSIIKAFLNDEFKMHEETPYILLEDSDVMFNVKGLKFSEFEEEVKQEIMAKTLTTYTISEEAPMEKIEELFLLLNNGVQLRNDQKIKPILGYKASEMINDITKHDFFALSGFSKAQIKNDAHISSFIQFIMLKEMVADEEVVFKNFSISEIIRYAESMEQDDVMTMLNQVKGLLDYAVAGLTKKHAFLKRTNMPMFLCAVEDMKKKNISSEKLEAMLEDLELDIETDDSHKYHLYSGNGSTHTNKVMGRYEVFMETVKNME